MLLVLVGTGCRGERPPGTPALVGPLAARPGETLEFRASATDLDGGNVSCLFDWDDGSAGEWTAEFGSGDTIVERHVYADSGVRIVRVLAKDETGLRSDWSTGQEVRVAPSGPLVPTLDLPGEASAGFRVAAVAAAGHVRGESISVQFDWGDSLGAWSGFVRAGTSVVDSHAWQATGRFGVRARARERAGLISLWCEPESVTVRLPSVQAPAGVRLASSSGVFVRLRWSPGANHDSVRYGIWFRPLDSVGFRFAGTGSSTSGLHDPRGATGDYHVCAWYGGDTAASAETLTTIPSYCDTFVLGELNTDSFSGFGWDTLTGAGRRLAMGDTASAGVADVYFTDLTPGRSGPSYYLASPAGAANDPGGVPEAGWRRTGLLGLAGGTSEPLPRYDSTLYQSLVDVSIYQAWVAVRTADDRYALVALFGPDSNNGMIRACCWFQPVRGLRLIRHHPPGRYRRW